MYDNEMSQDEINENIAQGLGSLCWWGLADTLITPDNLRAAMKAQGLDESAVPPIKTTTAIARAAREFKSGRKGRDAQRYRAEVVYKDTTRIEVQIQFHSKDENGRTSWLPHEKVAYDVATAQWDCAGSTKEAELFREVANKRMNFYDHVWVRQWLQGYMDNLNGFRVGSNFYTPADKTADVEKAKSLIRAIGNSEFWIVNVQNDADTHETVVQGARNNIESTLDGMLEKLSNWESSSRKIREDSAAQTVADFAELRSRAQLYSASLQVSLDDLTKAIDNASSRAQELVEGGQPEPAPVVAPEPAPESEPAPEPEPEPEAQPEPTQDGYEQFMDEVCNDEPKTETVAVIEAVLEPVVESVVEPVIEPVTLSEVEQLRAEFKEKTGKDAPDINDLDALKGLVAIVSGAF
jgi:hypothetical protein